MSSVTDINRKVNEYFESLCKAEIANERGRHRSIDGVTCVHPDTYRWFQEKADKYRLELIAEHFKND